MGRTRIANSIGLLSCSIIDLLGAFLLITNRFSKEDSLMNPRALAGPFDYILWMVIFAAMSWLALAGIVLVQESELKLIDGANGRFKKG